MRISDWSSDVCSSDLGGRVRIEVIDEGSGMTRDFIRHDLFKPFASTKAAGFGLGAFEALQLAQAMGGTIDVTSDPGKGSSFALRLPHADAGAQGMGAFEMGKAG